MVKRLIILSLLVSGLAACADEVTAPAQQSLALELVTPRNIEFTKCVQTFNFPVEKLFYMAILSVNANRFEIEELQSKMGYILFKAANKTFLMSVIKVDSEHSMLKITPADNVYYFPYGVVYNIYRYIEMNADEELQGLEVLSNAPVDVTVSP